MKNIQEKLFIKNNKIECFRYSGRDYYSFIKKYKDKGYSQVIISSYLMIRILVNYISDRKFKVINLNFMEEDDELKSEINELLLKMKHDEKKNEAFTRLLLKLQFLKDNTSIEIKNIEMVGKKKTKDENVKLDIQNYI